MLTACYVMSFLTLVMSVLGLWQLNKTVKRVSQQYLSYLFTIPTIEFKTNKYINNFLSGMILN